MTLTQEDRLCSDIEKMSAYISNNYSAANRVVLLQCLKDAVREELTRQAAVNSAKYISNSAAAEKLNP
jgi:cell division protein FtsX